jgi:hypothetical protein
MSRIYFASNSDTTSALSPRVERISGPEKFRSSAEKDFFNTICQKRKLLPPCSRVSFGKFAYAAAAIGQLAEAPMASKAASIVA